MVRPDNDEKFVYDLIVEPDSTGRFEYIAGAENALFVVAFELSTINNCTKAEQQAFEIIMAMITTSAKKLDALYKSTDHVDFLKKMKDIIQQIKGSIISIAIDYETGDNYSSAMSEGKSLSELVSTATTLFQSEEGTYSQACGVAFDYLMQEVFSQIASSLELGFRVIPESDTLDTLVLSVLDFYVIDSAPKIPSNPIIIVHFPDQEPLNEEGEHKGSEFGRRFHKMFHFSIKEDASHDIIIELFSSTDKKVLLTSKSIPSTQLKLWLFKSTSSPLWRT